MKVYEAIAAALAAEDCDTIFGLMGDGNMALWATLVRNGGFTFYSSRHEAAAVSMAEGYARATGRVGVAMATNGPGLTHCATPIVSAARYRMPLVLITGDSPFRDPYHIQHLDQRRFAEACEAKYISVNSPGRAEDDLREAFYAAKTRRGPVVFSMPLDIQDQEFKSVRPYRPSSAFIPPSFHPPTRETMEPIVEALMTAQRPVIIAGRGAIAANAKDEIVRLADRCGALLATSLIAKGLFEGHSYNIGISGGFSAAPTEKLLREADFVLAIGATLNYFTAGEHEQLFTGTKVARIDIAPAPEELATAPGLYMQADARLAAIALHDELQNRQVSKTGYRSPSTQALLQQDIPLPPRPTDGLDPRRLIRTLSNELPENVIVSCGTAHFWTFVIQHLTLPEGGQTEFSYGFGEIGSALPVTMGLAVATPDRPHVLVDGDGSTLQHLQEFDTVVRYGLQIIVLIMNDASLGAEYHKLRAKGFDPASAQSASPDFVAIARAHGGDGILLERESDLGAALRQGMAKGGLFVVDARTSPTTPNDRYRHVHFGEPNVTPLVRRGAPVD